MADEASVVSKQTTILFDAMALVRDMDATGRALFFKALCETWPGEITLRVRPDPDDDGEPDSENVGKW